MFLIVTTQEMSSYLFTTQICQLPSVITMTIAATRMYRSLADYAFSTTEMYKDSSYRRLLSVDDNLQKQQ
jgi:hypothetical protein